MLYPLSYEGPIESLREGVVRPGPSSLTERTDELLGFDV